MHQPIKIEKGMAKKKWHKKIKEKHFNFWTPQLLLIAFLLLYYCFHYGKTKTRCFNWQWEYNECTYA